MSIKESLNKMDLREKIAKNTYETEHPNGRWENLLTRCSYLQLAKNNLTLIAEHIKNLPDKEAILKELEVDNG